MPIEWVSVEPEIWDFISLIVLTIPTAITNSLCISWLVYARSISFMKQTGAVDLNRLSLTVRV